MMNQRVFAVRALARNQLRIPGFFKDAKNRKDAKQTGLRWLGASLLTCKIQLWLPVWPSSVVLPELTSYAVDIALRESTVVVSPRIHKTLGKAASEVISE